MKLSEYAKAIVAGIVPGVLMFFTLRSGGVTAEEWETIIATATAAAGLTWAVPNKTDADTAGSEGERAAAGGPPIG